MNRASNGIKKGIEQGIEEGLAQGDEKRIATAIQNMYDRKVSVEDMASFLGISIEKVSLVLESLGLTVPDVKE